MKINILVTGFGPFPGAPFNPCERLVARLAQLRRPALNDVRVYSHIFATSYAAVNFKLTELIAEHQPRALLMFGLSSRAKTIRIEMRARNALSAHPDATGRSLRQNSILKGAPSTLVVRGLGPAARAARVPAVPAVPSYDAGRYVCNYLCWRACEAVAREGGPRFATFVHVPQVARHPRPKSRRMADRNERHKTQHKTARRLTLDDLTRAGARMLIALAAAARR
jgi:pyroglutamyl-peptidase